MAINFRTLGLVDNTRAVLRVEIDKFLKEDIEFGEYVPKFSRVSVRTVHPFAIVQEGIIAGNKRFPSNIFPCVSIAITTETFRGTNFLGRKTSEGFLTQERLDAFDPSVIPVERRLYTKKAWDDLQAKLTAGDKMPYEQYGRMVNANVSLSIWAQNDTVKDALYEMIKMFIEVYQEEVFLDNNWEELSWNADRDGLYNFDFGRALYGSVFTGSGTYQQEYVRVDTRAATTITGITTPINSINDVNGNGSTYTSK